MKELDRVVRGEERTRSPHCAVFSPLFHVTERRKNEELKPQRLVSTSHGIDMSFFPEQLSKILHARTSTRGVFVEGTVCGRDFQGRWPDVWLARFGARDWTCSECG